MSARLFIVEGPDCSGKSTLAKTMAIQLNACYMHASGAKAFHPVMHDYHQSLLDNAAVNLSQGRSVVLDRHWPSELVYGQIFRPNVSDRVYDFQAMLTAVGKLNPIYIICDDEDVVVRHDRNKDDDHPYDHQKFQLVVDSYRQMTLEMMDSPALPALRHPRTPPSEMKFDVRRYSLLHHGATMGSFIDAL